MKKYQIALVGGFVLVIGQFIVLFLPLHPQTGPVGEGHHGLNWQVFSGTPVAVSLIVIGLSGLKKEKRK